MVFVVSGTATAAVTARQTSTPCLQDRSSSYYQHHIIRQMQAVASESCESTPLQIHHPTPLQRCCDLSSTRPTAPNCSTHRLQFYRGPVCWVLTVMPLGGRRQTMQPLACPDPPRLPLPVTIRRGAESRQPRQKTRCLSRLSHHCTPPDRQRVMSAILARRLPRWPVKMNRELIIWLYAPTASNSTWQSWYADLFAHRANVTGVAPCSYLMDSDGLFTTQVR